MSVCVHESVAVSVDVRVWVYLCVDVGCGFDCWGVGGVDVGVLR